MGSCGDGRNRINRRSRGRGIPARELGPQLVDALQPALLLQLLQVESDHVILVQVQHVARLYCPQVHQGFSKHSEAPSPDDTDNEA